MQVADLKCKRVIEDDQDFTKSEGRSLEL